STTYNGLATLRREMAPSLDGTAPASLPPRPRRTKEATDDEHGNPQGTVEAAEGPRPQAVGEAHRRRPGPDSRRRRGPGREDPGALRPRQGRGATRGGSVHEGSGPTSAVVGERAHPRSP